MDSFQSQEINILFFIILVGDKTMLNETSHTSGLSGYI